jgi:hypothetical protein
MRRGQFAIPLTSAPDVRWHALSSLPFLIAKGLDCRQEKATERHASESSKRMHQGAGERSENFTCIGATGDPK